MAQGGDVLETTQPANKVTTALSKFLKSSTWLYPIIRFLGHAIRRYHYDIEFIRCTVQEEDRNWILYESYCDLVGCLLGKFCKVHDIKPSKIVTEILATADAKPEPGIDARSMHSLNFIRATYRAIHFGYLMMSYCNLYKMKCCEDIREEMKQMKIVDSQKENWEGLWKYLNDEVTFTLKEQKRAERLINNHATMMVEEMQYGPFVCAYGIKLYDSDFNYDADVDQMLERMSDLHRRKASLKEAIVPKPKQKPVTDEEKIPDELARVFESTQLKEDSESPPSSEDDHDLHEMKAEALEHLDRMLIESPASRSFITVSERLVLATNNDTAEPQFYTAPSSPEKLESTQAPEESVDKSEQRRSSKSPEPPYITAPSTPEKSELTHSPKEPVTKSRSSESPSLLTVSPLLPEKAEPSQPSEKSVTKPTKSRKKRSSKSPRPRYVTAPSSPTMVRSKISSESPQALEGKLKIKKASSVKSAKQPSPERSLTLPNNDVEREEFILNAFDRRMKKQLAFFAATFVLQSAIGVKKGLKDLVNEQRWFEKKWSSPREAKSSEKPKKDVEITPGTAIEEREISMLDDVWHGQALLEILWKIFDARKSRK